MFGHLGLRIEEDESVSLTMQVEALIAAVVIGLVNGTIGFFLKVVTFPLTILTLGLFWLVINALMLEVAAALVPGFRIDGFLPAFFGAIVLSLVNMALRMVVGD